MTENIHMSNLNFILQAIFKYFKVTWCDDNPDHICDPSRLDETKLVQP